MAKKEFSNKPKGKSAVEFWENLKELFPDVQCERRFDWLFIPSETERSDSELVIYDALIAHCKNTKGEQNEKKCGCDCDGIFVSNGDGALHPITRKLEYDFFIPSLNVAIEFDERQHFTRERAVSLRHYRDDLNLEFSVGEWINRCDNINANDTDPPCRDWQRAFRDAVRDIRASENGLRLFRFAWDAEPEKSNLSELLWRPT